MRATRRACLLIAGVVLSLGSAAIGADLGWEQVVGDENGPGNGFGDPENQTVGAMAEFAGDLYVGLSFNSSGCQIWRSGDGINWTQTGFDGFGSSANTQARAMGVFENRLYVSTFNSSSGTEVWRTDNGTTWEQINADGFGDSHAWAADSMTVFQGRLYVGAGNASTGTEIWTFDGSLWEQVNTNGFGDPLFNGAEDLVIFENALYVTNDYNGASGHIWRSTNGTSWTQVFPIGSGSTNSALPSMAAFDGYLYTGTYRAFDGAEVWRSPDGTNWKKVASGGFSDDRNGEVSALTVFGAALYASTVNSPAHGLPISGTEIWRTTDGVTWTQVNADGFGDAINRETTTTTVFDGALYAGVYLDFMVGGGCELWRLPLVFDDDFESGGTTAWNVSVP